MGQPSEKEGACLQVGAWGIGIYLRVHDKLIDIISGISQVWLNSIFKTYPKTNKQQQQQKNLPYKEAMVHIHYGILLSH